MVRYDTIGTVRNGRARSATARYIKINSKKYEEAFKMNSGAAEDTPQLPLALHLKCGWYCTVRCGAVRYGTVGYGAVRHGTVPCGTAPYGFVRYGTVSTVLYGTAQ